MYKIQYKTKSACVIRTIADVQYRAVITAQVTGDSFERNDIRIEVTKPKTGSIKAIATYTNNKSNQPALTFQADLTLAERSDIMISCDVIEKAVTDYILNDGQLPDEA